MCVNATDAADGRTHVARVSVLCAVWCVLACACVCAPVCAQMYAPIRARPHQSALNSSPMCARRAVTAASVVSSPLALTKLGPMASAGVGARQGKSPVLRIADSPSARARACVCQCVCVCVGGVHQ